MENNQMMRDQRDEAMPVIKTVRVRSLAATTSSGANQTPALKFKVFSIYADAACWFTYGASPVAIAALTQLATVTITYPTAEADDVFSVTLIHQNASTSTYPLTITTEANASDVATALAALINAHGSYSAAAVAAVITITGPSNGDSYSVTGSATNGGSTSDEDIVITQPCPNIPLIANIARSIGMEHDDKVAAITSTGTATVYIEEHGN